jgi:hypothetical protein
MFFRLAPNRRPQSSTFMNNLGQVEIFFWDTQVGVPKLGLVLSQNFGYSYLFQIKSILRMQGK